MSEQKTVYEIAILGRITWNLHSLNNEGNIGNVIEPRTLKLADGSTADGISGEMLKHVHAAKVWELETDKNKFCSACQVIEPMRADANKNVTRLNNEKEDKEIKASSQAMQDCVLCDLHGFLVQKPNIHRQSTVEFGWAVGLPGQWHRDIHQHARHAVGFKGQGKDTGEPQPAQLKQMDLIVDEESDDEVVETTQESGVAAQIEEKPKTSQMLFSRPTRSGVYAIVTVFQPWRIGLNVVDYSYPIALDICQQRYKLALRAYESMFLRLDGAMTSTRLPHLESFAGAIVISRTNDTVPVLSPLADDYLSKLSRLAEVKNENGKTTFEVMPFADEVEFITKLRGLTNDLPYRLQKAGQKGNDDDKGVA